MLRWNRRDVLWSAVVLLSVFTPWVVADEPPRAKVVLKKRSYIQQAAAEEQPAEAESRGKVVLKKRSYISQAAAEETPPSPDDAGKEAAQARWNEIKSRFRAEEESTSASSTPTRDWVPTAQILPIPEDPAPDLKADQTPFEDSSELTDEPLAEPRLETEATPEESSQPVTEPLPITGFEDEPAWILSNGPRPTEPVLETVPRTAARTEDDLIDASAPALGPSEDPDAAQPAPEPEEEPQDVPMPKNPVSRRPRPIGQISPTYDTSIDQDIRAFAKEQAEQYGVEFSKGTYPPRAFPGLVYQWEPSNFYHYPLYFEDPALERYGHTYGDCLQPIASLARFGGQLVMLPYFMTLDPICTPAYTLGWYRPGEVSPKLHYQVPLNAHAAAVEAAVITGLFFAIP
jgi:hypothetical protein